MVFLFAELLFLFVLLCLWTWALCAILIRNESYGWLVVVLFLPPLGVALYGANRLTGGKVDAVVAGIQRRRSIAELRPLVASDPTFDRRIRLAEMLYAEGLYDECLKQLDEAMRIDDEDRRVQYLAAKALMARKHPPEAILPHLEFVLGIEPSFDNGEAALFAAQLHERLGQLDAALGWLTKAARRQIMPRVVLRQAELLTKLQRPEEALEALRALVELGDAKALNLHDGAQRAALAEARRRLARGGR